MLKKGSILIIVLFFLSGFTFAQEHGKLENRNPVKIEKTPSPEQCEDFQKLHDKYIDWKAKTDAQLIRYLRRAKETCLSEVTIGTWQNAKDPYLFRFPGILDFDYSYQNVCYNPADLDVSSYFKEEKQAPKSEKSLTTKVKECRYFESDLNRHVQFHINRYILLKRVFIDELFCDYIPDGSKHTFRNCKKSLKSSPAISYDDSEIYEWVAQYHAHDKMANRLIEFRSKRLFDCPLNSLTPKSAQLLSQCVLKPPVNAIPAEHTED